MSRALSIAAIVEGLSSCDDEEVEAVAGLMRSMRGEAMARAMTADERARLDEAREDFRHGRTVSLEDCIARTDALFARYAARMVVDIANVKW